MPGVRVEGFPTFTVLDGTSLLDACEAAGIPMGSDCGGFAACNACRVTVLSSPEALSPLAEDELGFLDVDGQRLGCQACVMADVAVRLDPGI